MLTTPLGRLRAISILEGVSYLALLGIAMPLKYLADQPAAVRVVGMIHGIFALLFFVAVLQVWHARRWPLRRVLSAFVASVLPFGAFVLEASLRREAQLSAAVQHS